jgi:hypothetical protein
LDGSAVSIQPTIIITGGTGTGAQATAAIVAIDLLKSPSLNDKVEGFIS